MHAGKLIEKVVSVALTSMAVANPFGTPAGAVIATVDEYAPHPPILRARNATNCTLTPVGMGGNVYLAGAVMAKVTFWLIKIEPEATSPARVVINNITTLAWLINTAVGIIHDNRIVCTPTESNVETTGADIAGGAGGTILTLTGEQKTPEAEAVKRAAT